MTGTYFYAPLFVKDVREDSTERTYALCTPVAKAGQLRNMKGEPVYKPAALVIYGLKAKVGDIVKTVVEGSDGVYTAVKAASLPDILEILEVKEAKELDFVPVREYESAYDEDGNEKETRYGRKRRKKGGRKNRKTDLSNEVTTVSAATPTQEVVAEELEDADKPA